MATKPPRKAGRPTGVAVDAALTGPSEAFLTELRASWARHGAATIELVRTGRPHDYLRLVASSLAKQPEGDERADAIDALSDDEIADELRRILAQLAAAGADPGT